MVARCRRGAMSQLKLASDAQLCCEIQEDKFRVVVAPPLDLGETFSGCERTGRFLDQDQRVGCEPAAGARRGQRLFGKTAAVGRIEKNQRERLDRMRGAELRGVAAENARRSAEPERRDVLADQR